jgi:competence protein ComEA
MSPAKKFVLGIPIPLNQADVEALEMIPGISERLAHRVINFRQARGPFKRWNDLKRVRGIGPKRIAKLQSYLILNRDSE